MTTDHEQALKAALGDTCTITIEPTGQGISVHASYTTEQFRDGGPTAIQALTQVGMRAIQNVMNEYAEKLEQQQPPLH